MARKGKRFNIKGFFVEHCEKMAFGLALVLVALALAGTSWFPYNKQPGEFTTRVEDARDNIATTTWPQEEREKFLLEEEALPRRIVDVGINDRWQVTPKYLHSQPQLKNKDARDDPLQEPEFLAVVNMEVGDGKVNIRQAPKYDDALTATDADGTSPDGTTPDSASSATEPEDDRPDEFQDRSGGAGAFPGGGAAGFGRAGMFGTGADEDREYDSLMAPELSRGRGAAMNPTAGAAAGRGRGRGRSRRGGDDLGPSTGADSVAGRGGSTRGRGRGGRSRAEGGDEEINPATMAAMAAAAGATGSAADYGYGGMGVGGGMETDGKGYPFVSVRGVFEFREQIRKYSDAIHKGRAQALQYFMIVDFDLERQRLITAPETWSDWEPVNDQVFRDILKEADGFDPDVVESSVTDSAITCPLPSRLNGMYRELATHERLDKFKLSDEDMERELEYNRLLLEQVLKQNKLPTGIIQKRGFNDMVFDARTVRQGVFGGTSPYGGFGTTSDDEDGSMGMRMGGRGMAGNPMGGAARGGMGGRQPPNPMLTKTIDQLARDLAERTQDADSEEATKQLKEWITARAVPQGDLLLFRYFDFDVEPGETYRYRVRLELQNPNYNAPLAATGGVASVREGQTRLTPWSEPTKAITVDETVNYFLTSTQPPRALVYPEARMKIYQYDQDVGTVVHHELDVGFGQHVGGKAKVEQADPGKSTIEEVDYTFKSEDILIDAIPDLRMSRTEHPDLQLPADSRGLAQISEYAAVVTPHGRIETIDQRSQAQGLKDAEKYMEQQDEYFAHLRGPDDVAGDNYSDLYDYGGDEDRSGLDMMMRGRGMGGGAGGRNPLRKGGGRGARGGGKDR